LAPRLFFDASMSSHFPLAGFVALASTCHGALRGLAFLLCDEFLLHPLSPLATALAGSFRVVCGLLISTALFGAVPACLAVSACWHTSPSAALRLLFPGQSASYRPRRAACAIYIFGLICWRSLCSVPRSPLLGPARAPGPFHGFRPCCHPVAVAPFRRSLLASGFWSGLACCCLCAIVRLLLSFSVRLGSAGPVLSPVCPAVFPCGLAPAAPALYSFSRWGARMLRFLRLSYRGLPCFLPGSALTC